MHSIIEKVDVFNFTMSESEEESSNSENNWPMNEDWMLDILKDDKTEAKVKINVIENPSPSISLPHHQYRFVVTHVNWIEGDLT